MLSNFEELKKQLTELAVVINLYKSEAVQLKIVERLLQASGGSGRAETAHPVSEELTPRIDRDGGKRKNPSAKPRGNRSSKLGPAGALNRLIGEGFFRTKRTLNDILGHCRSKMAKQIKPNDMSGPLARFVRNGTLDREKNKEGQFEYVSK
jgi:hypothetical protein